MINKTTTDANTTTDAVPTKSLSLDEKSAGNPAPAVPVVDLSNYAKDRKDKNLTAYRNIPYPMGESRGPPAAASSGGGGCGCSGG